MRIKSIIKSTLIAALSVLIFGCNSSNNIVNIVINTSMGDIVIELYEDKAPKTVKNFLRYVDSKRYDNSSFIRSCTPENEAGRDAPITVIQSDTLASNLHFDPIDIETTEVSGIKHTDGAISMARETPNSATASFFLCIGDQPSLDFRGARNPDGYGFAAFGKVIKGMDVVKAINREKERGQYFIDPVKIISIRRK